MSVAITLRFVEIFRAHGVPVTFEPGWETRGNGQTSAYEGGIVHHTATAISDTRPQILVTGRSNLAGPLCNFAGLGNGGIHVIAAQPANHAGASGGRSMGPLPVTTVFNRRVLGLEIVYPGTSPMTAAQMRTAKVFAKAVAQIFGTVERCRAHAETSITGKWDPGYAPDRTIDMTTFRREAANVSGEDLDMDRAEVTDIVYTTVRNLLRDMANGHQPADPTAVPELVRRGLDREWLTGVVRDAVVQAGPAASPDTVATKVVDAIKGLNFRAA